MMKTKPKIFFGTLILFFCQLFFLPQMNAEFYRAKLEVPAPDVYNTIFNSMENKDFEKIETAAAYVFPIMEHIKIKYGVNLRAEFDEAVNAKNSDMLRSAMEKLIFYDMLEIFDFIIAESAGYPRDEIAAWLRVAYGDYLMISSAVTSGGQGFVIDTRIKRMFGGAYKALGVDNPYGEKGKEINIKLFTDYSRQIQKECQALLREFKVQ